MERTIEYWRTRRGIFKGNIPNRKAYLYLAYKRWCAKELGDNFIPLRYRKWDDQMRKWGAETMVYKAKGRVLTCYLLNKWVVPKASMRGTDYDEESLLPAIEEMD